jgi:hypothetical protein
MILGRPGGVVFAEVDFEESFRGQNVYRQAAVPERDAEPQHRPAFQIDFAAVDGDFENAVEGCFGNSFGIKKAKAPFFYREFLQMSAHKLNHNVYFFASANGDAEFRIFKFS